MQGPAFYPVNLQVPSGDLREGNPAPRLVSVIFQDSNGTPWIQMAVNGTELDLPEFDEIRM
jgi:hypothetical protein